MCTLCFQEIDGILSYFNADGEIDNSEGLKKKGKDWYYLQQNGNLLKSQSVGNLYFDEKGVLVLYDTLFESPMGIQYYDSDGRACVDCVISIDDKLYYFDILGLQDISKGWKKSGEDWYFIDEDGEFVQDNWVGRYYIGPEGIMITNQYIDRFYRAVGRNLYRKGLESGR